MLGRVLGIIRAVLHPALHMAGSEGRRAPVRAEQQVEQGAGVVEHMVHEHGIRTMGCAWTRRLFQLPSIEDIMTTSVSVKECTSAGFRKLFRVEYGRLCGQVVRFNMSEAWDFTVGTDTVETRCWVAWVQFPKCVLRADGRAIRAGTGLEPWAIGEQAKHAYVRAKNSLETWMSGERKSLWMKLTRGVRVRGATTPEEMRSEKLFRSPKLGEQGRPFSSSHQQGHHASASWVGGGGYDQGGFILYGSGGFIEGVSVEFLREWCVGGSRGGRGWA